MFSLVARANCLHPLFPHKHTLNLPLTLSKDPLAQTTPGNKRGSSALYRDNPRSPYTITVLGNAPCRTRKRTPERRAVHTARLHLATNHPGNGTVPQCPQDFLTSAKTKPKHLSVPKPNALVARRNHSSLLRHYRKSPDTTATKTNRSPAKGNTPLRPTREGTRPSRKDVDHGLPTLVTLQKSVPSQHPRNFICRHL